MRRTFRQLLSILLIACLGFQPVVPAGGSPCAPATTAEPAAADPHAGHAMPDPGATDAVVAQDACDCGCSCVCPMAGCVGVAAALPSLAHGAGPHREAAVFPLAGATAQRLAAHGHPLFRPPSRS